MVSVFFKTHIVLISDADEYIHSTIRAHRKTSRKSNMEGTTSLYIMFLLCSLSSINIYKNSFDITWLFILIYLLQILVLPNMIMLDIKHDMQVRIQTFSMFILMNFVDDFNIKYIIRLISWIYTTPVLLHNILSNNTKRTSIIILHEIAYMTELLLIIFKLPACFESIVYGIFLIILFIYIRHSDIYEKYQLWVKTGSHDMVYLIGETIYNEFLVVLWFSYGIVRLAYLFGLISSLTEWLLFNVLDTITKSTYLFLKRLNLDIVKKNAIVSKQIQSAYTKESLLYLQPYLDAAINYDQFISLPKQVNKIENVIVIFFDLIGYTEVSSRLNSNQIANVLSDLYSNIDTLLINFNKVKKVETVGDEYMAIISLENDTDITDCVLQSILFVKHSLETISKFKHISLDSNTNREICTSFLGARAGLHTGLVTKAIIGLFMPRTQYFGSVVNIGSRMENTGKPNMIRISADMMQLISKCDLDIPATEEWIEVKGIGIMQTYIIDIRNIDISHKNALGSSLSSLSNTQKRNSCSKAKTSEIEVATEYL